VVRSNLYSDGGDLIAEDIQTFDVCRKQATLSGVYLRNASDNDTSPFILSRVRLIDFYTLEILEKEITGDHGSYSLNASSGKYFLIGECVSKNGRLYTIPMIMVNLKCGEVVQRNLILEYTGKIDTEWLETSSNSQESKSGFSTSAILLLDEHKLPLRLSDGSSTCSKPKVFVSVDLTEAAINLLQERPDLRDASPERIKRYFSTLLAQRLKSVSPGVEIYSYGETAYALGEIEEFLAENPGAEADTSKITPVLGTEYIYSTRIDSDEFLNYYLNSDLIDRDTTEIVGGIWRATGSELDEELDGIIQRHGDIEPLIKAYETTHLVPPRDPNLEITIEPQSVSPESELTRKSLIIARVTNCNGEPAYDRFRSQKVFFQKTTERGTVRTKVTGEYGVELKDYELEYTYKEGIAHAHYTLTKGIEAGEDKVTIITFGRGFKRVTATANIKINGIGVEVKLEKSELAPRQDTLIHVDLYEIDKDGNRKPLEAKVITVDKSYLKDSELISVGATDILGNPKTDYEGRATLKFIAGKKEGLIKIPVKYQTELGEVRDTAVIKIKKEEFVVLIDWKQNYEYSYNWVDSGSWCGPGMGGEYCTAGTRTFNSRGGYSYNFKSQTIWERTSGSERTSADLTFKRGDSYSESWVVEWSVTSSIGREHSSYNGEVNGNVHLSLSSTRNTPTEIIIEDRRSGTLYISINPIRFYMLILGTGSGSGSESHSYSGYLVDYQFDCTSSWSGSSSYSSTHTVTYQADSINDAWSSSYSERGFQVINCPSYTLSYPHSSSSSGSHSYSLNRSWSSYPNAYKVAGGHTGSFSGYAGPYFRSSGSMLYLEYVTLKKIGRDSWEPYENHYQLSLYGEGENSASNGQLNGDIKIRVVKG
jgi:hypothetical protein